MAEEIKFEEALEKLEDIVNVLETGDLSLEESLEAFEEGVRLSKVCSKWLNDAELRVEKLTSIDEDTVETEPFEIPPEG
ncbi:MAG: exodeoxyribonuclease VII small subunit [Candidatus Poribacteria bacterium]